MTCHVLLHPNHAEMIETEKDKIKAAANKLGHKEIKFHVVAWYEINLVAATFGMDARDRAFWNPENIFLLDQVAWDNLTKPIIIQAYDQARKENEELSI